MRSAYGLSTIGDTWEEHAACRRPDVDPDVFHPASGRAGTRQAALALHTCHTHCDVRAECHADAVRFPPAAPQVIGGVRYTASGTRTARPQTDPVTTPSRVGCRICQGKS